MKGYTAIQEFKYDEAIRYYEKAFIESNNTNALSGKAYALSKLNQVVRGCYKLL